MEMAPDDALNKMTTPGYFFCDLVISSIRGLILVSGLQIYTWLTWAVFSVSCQCLCINMDFVLV